MPEAALQNLTPYGDLENNFRFLKEAKIMSNFVRINLDAQSKFMSAEGGPRKVDDCLLEDVTRIFNGGSDFI